MPWPCAYKSRTQVERSRVQYSVECCSMCIDRTNSVHSCKIYVLQICENRKLQHTTDYIQSRWSCFSTQRQSQAIHVYSTGSCTRVGLEVVQMCAHWQPKTQQWSFDHLSAHVDQGKKWPDTTPDTHHYYNCVSAIVRPSGANMSPAGFQYVQAVLVWHVQSESITDLSPTRRL